MEPKDDNVRDEKHDSSGSQGVAHPGNPNRKHHRKHSSGLFVTVNVQSNNDGNHQEATSQSQHLTQEQEQQGCFKAALKGLVKAFK